MVNVSSTFLILKCFCQWAVNQSLTDDWLQWISYLLTKWTKYNGKNSSSSLRLSLLPLLTNTLPGPSASEVTTLRRYTNLFIIIIIIIIITHWLMQRSRACWRRDHNKRTRHRAAASACQTAYRWSSVADVSTVSPSYHDETTCPHNVQSGIQFVHWIPTGIS